MSNFPKLGLVMAESPIFSFDQSAIASFGTKPLATNFGSLQEENLIFQPFCGIIVYFELNLNGDKNTKLEGWNTGIVADRMVFQPGCSWWGRPINPPVELQASIFGNVGGFLEQLLGANGRYKSFHNG